ncbi:hypothetical protein MAR_000099 [Mya arenaria]|uniref:Uncharacterized protein n=1 Tax=Mya arenaria TaxID=6604 RepID=A0ABY7FBU5_MYAAR|nr:hypothetical protein MAR_000099 [Mya arenaria]
MPPLANQREGCIDIGTQPPSGEGISLLAGIMNSLTLTSYTRWRAVKHAGMYVNSMAAVLIVVCWGGGLALGTGWHSDSPRQLTRELETILWCSDPSTYSQSCTAMRVDELGMTTDDKRHLKLEDVAGLPVGHAPRSLTPYFRNFIDRGGKVSSEVTGAPVPSYPPWPAQHEEGGGVVLPCNYIISTSCEDDFKVLSDALNAIREGASMELVMS